ncbi:MAG: hypothetical protein WC178_00640 [Candidatus Paceibacterota bacterium]
MKAKNKPKNNLEIKSEELEQYSCCDDDPMNKKSDKYAPLIGYFLMNFSDLEHQLDDAIADLVFDDAHYEGYTIIKNLRLWPKIELFYDLAYPRIFYAGKRGRKINQLKRIRTRLENLATLRNKIAHAKWYTLDKEGYVRVEITTSKDNGLIAFKRYKITIKIIKRGIREIEALSEKLFDFTENIDY